MVNPHVVAAHDHERDLRGVKIGVPDGEPSCAFEVDRGDEAEDGRSDQLETAAIHCEHSPVSDQIHVLEAR